MRIFSSSFLRKQESFEGGRKIPAFAGMTTIIIAALLLNAPAQADELKAVRTVTVNGLAKDKIVPDQAHITVNLNAADMELTKAKQTHDQKLQKLMNIVKDFKIDDKKVGTQSSNVSPIYTYETDARGNGKQIFKGYRVQTSVDITVEDTGKLAKLSDTIMKAGFDKDAPQEWGTLMNMYYTLSNPDEIRDEMLVKAIANAKAKADKMAAAVGSKVARVFQINEGGGFSYNPQPVPMMAMMEKSGAGGMADAAIAPPAGEQEVQSTVTVIFELE